MPDRLHHARRSATDRRTGSTMSDSIKVNMEGTLVVPSFPQTVEISFGGHKKVNVPVHELSDEQKDLLTDRFREHLDKIPSGVRSSNSTRRDSVRWERPGRVPTDQWNRYWNGVEY